MAVKIFRVFLIVPLISLISIIQITPVSAEAIWKIGSSTPPRNGNPFVNFKSAPCRDFSRTKRIKIYKPGDSILAQWSETQDHFGSFQFNLLQVNSATGLDEFVMPVFSDVVDDINGVITGSQYHEFQKNFILPTRLANGTVISNGDFVLQLIHQATSLDAPADATTNPVFKYYSCSDIRLESVNSNDNTAPDNVSNFGLVYSSNNISLSWMNPVSNGTTSENLAYKVLVLMDQTAANTVTSNQLANKEFSVGDILNQTTKVIYAGNGENLVLYNNTSNTNYFKIFSYDVNSNYSSGVSDTGPKIMVSVAQGSITDANLLKVNNGNITVSVSVTSTVVNETFSFDWTQNSQSVLVDSDGVIDNASFVVDSSALAAGNYTLQFTLTSSTGSISTIMQNLILLENNQAATSAEPALAKKVDLGGCSFVSQNASFDPLLLILVIISLLFLVRNRAI
jgi:hypothetical protein